MSESAKPISKREALEALEELYLELEQELRPLEALHRERLQCKPGCSQCCIDRLTVFEIEARNIRRFHSRFLAEAEAAPEGSCAFLDAAGYCRIYENRPYVCRTQGLPLRWLEQKARGWVELRDICPLNEGETSLEELPEEECWTLGPFEEKLARLQARIDGGKMRRVPLRSLFHRAI